MPQKFASGWINDTPYTLSSLRRLMRPTIRAGVSAERRPQRKPTCCSGSTERLSTMLAPFLVTCSVQASSWKEFPLKSIPETSTAIAIATRSEPRSADAWPTGMLVSTGTNMILAGCC